MRLWKYIIIFFTILFCGAYAFDWPLNPKIILSSFCQYNGDGLSTGIRLSGSNEPVYAIAPGELIFSHREGENNFALPYGLGSFMVLWHEGGIQSVYCQLETETLNVDKTNIEKEQMIGTVGDTGSTIGNNLRLILIDMQENEILNPVKNLIPYYEDTKKPVIQGIFIKRNDEIIQLQDNQIILPGSAEILVESWDLREDIQRIWKIAPYHIILFYNGQEQTEISFDAIREKDNRQVIDTGEFEYSDIYEENWMFKLGNIDFLEGKSHVLVRVSDFSGNTVSSELFIDVKRP